jgi:hypothetical protein
MSERRYTVEDECICGHPEGAHYENPSRCIGDDGCCDCKGGIDRPIARSKVVKLLCEWGHPTRAVGPGCDEREWAMADAWLKERGL